MYTPTIGLEIHAELKTRTKMFCSCKNDTKEKEPNKNVCPICLGHPGTLPTINKEAIKSVIKVGIALNGKIADYSQFDRKSYFYPDLPKGYQISQYKYPLIENAILNGVRIKRIHIEEDTGKLIHDTNNSLVDFNRAGIPLMELVTEPDIKNAEEAVNFAQTLQSILKYLGVSEANMENGEMRIEANISLAKNNKLGTKTEVKNINSFKAVKEAIEYEIKRQGKILEKGEEIVQETRGWDDIKKITVSQRSKESAHDYRYFPEPDLPPLKIKDLFDLQKIKKEIPELPNEKRERFLKEYGISENIINILTEEKERADYFENAFSELKEKIDKADPRLLANYLTSDVLGLIKEKNIDFKNLKIKPEHLAHLIFFIQNGELTSRTAKDILAKMVESGEDPENIIKTGEMQTMSDKGEMEKIIEEIIKENEKSVEDYKKGKKNALQYIIGQVIKKTKGRADPKIVTEILEKKLNNK